MIELHSASIRSDPLNPLVMSSSYCGSNNLLTYCSNKTSWICVFHTLGLAGDPLLSTVNGPVAVPQFGPIETGKEDNVASCIHLIVLEKV